MRKKKINSYVKMVLWMFLGACIGAGISVFVNVGGDSLVAGLDNLTHTIAEHILTIMIITMIVSVAAMILCYFKSEQVVKQSANDSDQERDDQEEETLDRRYNNWSSVGMAISSTMIFLFMIYLGFVNIEKSGAIKVFIEVGIFLVNAAFCCFYQVALVKQMRRKDPNKKGDAADMRFEKDWIASCDEAERRMVYETGYKTFSFMKIFLAIMLLIAVLGQLAMNTGVAAIVLIGGCQIVMLIVYSVYGVKIQNGKME